MDRDGFYFFLPFVLISFIFMYLFHKYLNIYFVYLGVISFTLACMFVLFFRDPVRKIPEGDNLIVAPADGKIVESEKTDTQIVISIFLSVFDVHVNRIPVTGTIERVTYRPGKFKAAFKKSASDLNERFEIEIKTDKYNVTVHQIAGVLARRVVCRLKTGQSVEMGDRFGLIRFGSRTDLFLPASAKIDIKKGQKVRGGETVIGRLD